MVGRRTPVAGKRGKKKEIHQRSDERARWSFAQVLCWHLDVAGTRPLGNRAWNIKGFAAELNVDPRTVRNWRKGENLPNDLVQIERVLFGQNSSDQYLTWRNELRDLFSTSKSNLSFNKMPSNNDVLLRVDHSHNNAWQKDSVLASIELFTTGVANGACEIAARLICRPAPFPISEIGVHRGKLIIRSLGGAINDLLDQQEVRKWHTINNDAGLCVGIEKIGVTNEPGYIISVDDIAIGDIFFPHSSWIFAEILHGDTITYTFQAYIGDLAIKKHPSYSFTRADGKPLDIARQRILERFQIARLGAEEGGWVDLCGDGLRFEE